MPLDTPERVLGDSRESCPAQQARPYDEMLLPLRPMAGHPTQHSRIGT
jgi:hypothetical protein